MIISINIFFFIFLIRVLTKIIDNHYFKILILLDSMTQQIENFFKLPYKGLLLCFLSILFSLVVLIYFFAWESTNKINQNSNYQVSLLEEGSLFLCPLH